MDAVLLDTCVLPKSYLCDTLVPGWTPHSREAACRGWRAGFTGCLGSPGSGVQRVPGVAGADGCMGGAPPALARSALGQPPLGGGLSGRGTGQGS